MTDNPIIYLTFFSFIKSFNLIKKEKKEKENKSNNQHKVHSSILQSHVEIFDIWFTFYSVPPSTAESLETDLFDAS